MHFVSESDYNIQVSSVQPQFSLNSPVDMCLRQFVFLITLCYWDISVPAWNKSVSHQSRSGRVRSSNHFLPLYLNHFLIHLPVQHLHYMSWFLLSP